MFFRAVFLVALIVWGSGCQFFTIQEPRITGDSFRVEDRFSGCLDGYEDKLQNFWKGPTAKVPARKIKADIEDLADCGVETLKTFKKFVRGKTREDYSAKSLRDFIQKFYLSEHDISDSLLTELFALKVAVVGGVEEWTNDTEIDRTIDLIESVSAETIRLVEFMPVGYDRIRSLDGPSMNRHLTAYKRAAQVIGQAVAKNATSYPLDRLQLLREEFAKVLSAESMEKFDFIKTELPLVKMMKELWVSGPSESIQGTEFETVSVIIADLFDLVVRLGHLESRHDRWFEGEGLAILSDVLETGLLRIDQALARQDDRMWTFDQLDRLIDAVYEGTLIDPIVSKKVLKEVAIETRIPVYDSNGIPLSETRYSPVFNRVLAGADFSDQGRFALGLTQNAVERVRSSVREWSSLQSALEELYVTTGDSVSALHSLGFSQDRLLNTIPQLYLDAPSSAMARTNRSQTAELLENLVGEFRPFYRGESDEIYFPEGRGDGLYSFNNLSQINWIRSVTRLAFQGYIADPAMAAVHEGLSVSELDRFYRDFFNFNDQMDWIHPSSINSAKLRFREGNLFTFHSNGDYLLDGEEGIELLAFLLSGKHMSHRDHFYIANQLGCGGGSKPELDEIGYPQIPQDCFTRAFFGHVDRFWKNMPSLRKYYAAVLRADRENGNHRFQDWFIENFSKAARGINTGKPLVNGPDAEGYGALPHYIEAMFARFDTDRSKRLEYREAMKAFDEVFWQTIGDKGEFFQEGMTEGHRHVIKQTKIKPVFVYLLDKGKFPEGLGYLWWKNMTYNPRYYNLSVGRGRVLEIFAILSNNKKKDIDAIEEEGAGLSTEVMEEYGRQEQAEDAEVADEAQFVNFEVFMNENQVRSEFERARQ